MHLLNLCDRQLLVKCDKAIMCILAEFCSLLTVTNVYEYYY